MRRLVKNVVEVALHGSGLPTLGRVLVRSRVLVLAYHNVVPDDHEPSGDRSLHLPRRRFASQLDELRRHADVVPLADAIQGRRKGRRPTVAITFDDAYRGAVTLGVEELAARGFPATIFVCPGRLDGHTFWWDRFAGTGPGFRETALEECRGRDELVTSWAEAHGLHPATVTDSMTSAPTELLRGAVEAPGITVGAHTWSHPNLARAAPEEMARELDGTAVWLRETFAEAFVPFLAYPYGLRNATAERAAAMAGYRAGLLIDGGWLRPPPVTPFSVPRMNVPAGLSARGFALRLTGLLRT